MRRMNASLRPAGWLVGLLALGLLSPAQVRAWQYGAGTFEPAARQPARVSATGAQAADLDGDGIPEQVVLREGSAEIRTGVSRMWLSPPAWQVSQAAIADLNRDRRPELAFLVWRTFQPWPIDRNLVYGGRIQDFHNSAGQSCHVILIGWDGDVYRELWAGSAMADPFLSITAADLDGDGRQELVALEGSYADPTGDPARALTAWEWNGFGFSLLARVRGPFRQMAVGADPAGRALLLTQE
jgi:hypothetical protein